jgi:formate-dependent nitrite reductase membrane component NrfD
MADDARLDDLAELGGRRPGQVRAGDGRNVDPEVGLLIGEAAEQSVPTERATTEGGPPSGVWTESPAADGHRAGDVTYYDRPVVKEPVWIWTVPAYFYAGGAAGAAAAIGAAATLIDRDGLSGLITRSRWIAAVGGAVGTAGLIADLGKPGRFLNMLRVFRPSSPMSVGSWILAGSAPLAAGSAFLSGTDGALGAVGDAANVGAGLLGGPLAGYTGVLLANTAVPVWQASRRWLGPLFVASGLSAAAGLLQTMKLSDREARIIRRLAVASTAAELVVDARMEKDAGHVERVATALHEGRGGLLAKVSKAMSAAAIVLTLAGPRRRGEAAVAGLLATLGSLALKFGIFHAGKASALDPRATFGQQREGYGAAEITGAAAVTGPGPAATT